MKGVIRGSVQLVHKKERNLSRIKCPYCGNDNLIIVINFKEGRDSKKHAAKCVVKIYKPSIVRKFRRSHTRGCGRIFKIEIPKELEKI